MKVRQIKNRKELPETFSLEKYQPTYSFEIADWLVNLEMRVLAMHTRLNCGGYFDDEVRPATEYMLNNPIIKSGGFEKFPGLRKHINASNVRDFTAIDFFYCGADYSTDDRYKKYTDEVDSLTSVMPDGSKESNLYESKLLDIPYYKMLEDIGITHESNALIEVDLHGSDEKIMSDFSRWLTMTRQEMGIVAPKKKFTRSDFDEWAKNAILPYLDLTAWAGAHGFEITQQVLGITLFPEEYDVNLAERIRKVIAPAARTIAREVFTDALRSQAMAEHAESNSSKIIPGKFDNNF